ncbi:hypothetical protein CEF21_10780 [Bacillus sp. FJAT-42376]|uniref:hypothetical protein n=1 Tax=Bacillus sp. FJAT-42376 TaxID=2014076 RepID=UPI000F4FF67C|nr:hypothetical protein [Bacillus sp. FJAT-42376]AZB42737.1 hypothetical protein CEF21_10780 [Bacillus sp. FJAT-42376]
MIEETSWNSWPMKKEAAILLYKTDKVEEFLAKFPDTRSIYQKIELEDENFSLHFKKAAMDLEDAERELKTIGLQLKQEMDKTIQLMRNF